MTLGESVSPAFAAPARAARKPLWIILSLILIALAGAAALVLVQGVDRQLQDVRRTYEVRKLAGDLILSITEAETGQRGYILTGDGMYLQPYRDAISQLESRMQSLLDALADRPAQQARIAALNVDIERKRSEMALTVDLVAAGRRADALGVIGSDTGNTLMTGLRRAVDAFVANEDELLVQRNASVAWLRNGLVAAILTALAGAATLAYLLFTRTQKQVVVLSRRQDQLRNQNEELEARVRQRTSELEDARQHADRERERVEALLQETNHRIGNSLATVSSLLALQMLRAPSSDIREALEAARDRVHAIASGHRRLRLGADFETASADAFLTAVVEDMQAPHKDGDIRFETRFDPVIINARDATTIGIVLGELVTNALKHAFPDERAGTIWISLLAEDDGSVVLAVEDDGIGIAPDAPVEQQGLGTLVIKQLARQFGGEPVVSARPGGGTRVALRLTSLAVSPEPAA